MSNSHGSDQSWSLIEREKRIDELNEGLITMCELVENLDSNLRRMLQSGQRISDLHLPWEEFISASSSVSEPLYAPAFPQQRVQEDEGL